MNYKLSIACAMFIVCSLFCTDLDGQNTVKYDKCVMEFERGVELFNHGHYDASQNVLNEFMNDFGDVADPLQLADVAYYTAICSVRTNSGEASRLVMDFIDVYPTDLRVNYAWFCLGNYYFEKGKSWYKNALDAYSEVNEIALIKSDKDEYWFNLAMCYYKNDDSEKAQPIFSKLIKEGNKYYIDALYYYSFIAYNNSNYSTALEGFLKLVDDERYGSGLNYTIAHIYYEQRDLDNLVFIGAKLLTSRDGKKVDKDVKAKNAVLERMIGELYFRSANYAEALKYLNMYAADSKKVDRYDQWMMGYCNYKLGNYDLAMDCMQKVVSGKDSLDYNAQYHIGICYLKSGDKTFAQKAFYNSYLLSFDKTSKENALFNYAKLSYELASDPYKAAIGSLQEYLDTYPDENSSDEARGLLMQLLVMTKNYAEAVSVLSTMKFKKIDVMMLEQKLCYYYGVELFNASKYSQAMQLFSKSGEMMFYPDIAAQSLYWEGECCYMLKRYGEAVKLFDEFIESNAGKKSPYYSKGYYSKGYCYFKLKEYGKALSSFKKMLALPDAQKNSGVYYDAMLRLADCLQQTKFYSEAISYYDKCYKAGVADSDYALYQEALCYGAMGQFGVKGKLLKQFVNSYNKSIYKPSACYELAMTSLIQNNDVEALQEFEYVAKTFPKSVYASRALLKQGLIYYNDGNNANALEKLKFVVSSYGGTAEALEALATISNIYVEMNDINAFAGYVKTVPNAKFGEKDRDSLLFISAEKRYLAGDCQGAKPGLEEYLKSDGGRFMVNASYYLGDCLFNDGKYDDALVRFEAVIKQPQGIFSETAYSKAAAIAYQKKDYSRSLSYYEELEKLSSNKSSVLEAELGIMRSAYGVEDYEKSSNYARKLMANDKVTEELLEESHLVLGKAAYMADNYKLAMTELKIARQLSKGELGAEAGYLMALIQFKDKKYNDAEKAAFDVINSYIDYEYWRVESFILLADVYMAMGNRFQATQTLQSVVDNCEIEELKTEAENRLNEINKSNN